MGSTPYPGTIQDLTFNLFSILADPHLSANALFWITVWITAVGRGSWALVRGLLGLVARSRSNWLEGFGGGTGFHISPLKIEMNEVLET